MYEYKYVETQVNRFMADDDYKSIINQNAKQGWRVVQIVPIKFGSYGQPKKHEIIFERKVDEY
jgi:hypothetical protein